MSDVAEFLSTERDPILEAAEAGLARMHVQHYETAGAPEVQQRLAALYDHLVESIQRRDLGPMVSYAERVAVERFTAGYDLSDVQVAFNALEEATWSRVLSNLEASDFADAIGLISTVLGAGKDALAREYVSLAAERHIPSLDLRALFAGTAS
jgi:hypothetical protein